MRKTLIVANWKMNKPVQDFPDYLAVLREHAHFDTRKDLELALAPAYPYLAEAQSRLAGTGIHLCAQNMHEAAKGAFTGEVSLAMLKEFGVSRLILGHSERRQHCHESDALICKKVQACVESHTAPPGLAPMLGCLTMRQPTQSHFVGDTDDDGDAT